MMVFEEDVKPSASAGEPANGRRARPPGSLSPREPHPPSSSSSPRGGDSAWPLSARQRRDRQALGGAGGTAAPDGVKAGMQRLLKTRSVDGIGGAGGRSPRGRPGMADRLAGQRKNVKLGAPNQWGTRSEDHGGAY